MKIFLILILVNISLISFAQTIENDVFSSCGSTYESENVNLSFTIGETMVETYEQENLILNQGFHQASYTITDISIEDNAELEISLYPNPAIDFVNINCKEQDFEFRLINIEGKIILNGIISEHITIVPLSNISEGQFLIEVYSTKNSYRKTFKLVKQLVKY